MVRIKHYLPVKSCLVFLLFLCRQADNVLTVLEEDLSPCRIKHRIILEVSYLKFACRS